MAKHKIKAPAIYELFQLKKNGEPLPIYHFFGKDKYALEKAPQEIEKRFSSLFSSEFDKETIHATKSTLVREIIDVATAFPFGGGKKLVIVKQFNLIKDKKDLAPYVENPADFTILILLDDSDTVSFANNPYKALLKKGYSFEAKQPAGSEWPVWIIKHANELKISISAENAQRLLDIVGEEKQLLMRQLEKLRDYIGENGTVTKEHILKLASPTKTYTTFELQEAFLDGNKTKLIKIGFHLLNNGIQLYEILPMFTSAIYLLAQSFEVRKNSNDLKTQAKEAGAHWFYYKKITSSKYFKTQEKIEHAAKALLEADISVKTTGGNPKTIFMELVAKIFATK